MARHITQDRIAVLGLGFTYKENCSDIRNTRVADIVSELTEYSVSTEVFDPWGDAGTVRKEYGLTPVTTPGNGVYDATIVAVEHREFREMGAATIRAFGRPGAVLYDIKGVFPKSDADLRL